jgi:hypothetical protein
LGELDGRKLITPRLPVFLARDKTFTLTGNVDGIPFSILGENPGFGKVFPSLIPESLPIVRKFGTFEFEMAAPQLILHSRGHSFSPNIKATEGGVSRDGWFAFHHSLFDPLGSRDSMISTNEPVWGVDVQISRKPGARWGTNEFFEFDAKVPVSGAMTLTGLSHRFGGAIIDDIRLMGSGAFVFTNGFVESGIPFAVGMRDRWSSSSGAAGEREMRITRDSPWLLVSTAGISGKDRLTVSCRDESGKELRQTSSRSGNNGGGFTTRIYSFKAPTTGGKLRIRISFEKPYSFQTFISTRDLKIVQK